MNKTGSGNRILDWAVIIVAGLLFFKTADVAGYFAPTNLNYILGMDASWLYGVVCALIVEGVALALHFDPRTSLSSTAQIVKWTLLVMSGAAQIFDGYIATGTEASMSEPLKLGLQYGVPLIPLIVLVLLFAIGRLPDDGTPTARVGLKHRLPNWKQIWHGDPGAVSTGKNGPEDIPQGRDNGHQAELEARPRRNK